MFSNLPHPAKPIPARDLRAIFETRRIRPALDDRPNLNECLRSGAEAVGSRPHARRLTLRDPWYVELSAWACVAVALFAASWFIAHLIAGAAQ